METMTNTTKPRTIPSPLDSLIAAAEENLRRYQAAGDERAIRAGRRILDGLRAMVGEDQPGHPGHPATCARRCCSLEVAQ